MKLKEYIIDKRFAVLFYVVIMLFISLVIYLDESMKVSLNNLVYINFVSMIFFVVYLLLGYHANKRYYENINYIIENEEEDIINHLPKPKTHEQNMYYQLIKKIYEEQTLKIEKLHRDKVDNQEFITSWVHEIKTPIAVSRLTIENSMNNPNEDTLYSIEDEIDKIDNYVEQALYYSKIDGFSKDYFIKETNLGKLLKDIVKKHAKTFISKRIRIEMDDSDIEVLTDKKWLTFIVNQIMSNSLKYTSQGGLIKVRIEKDENEKRLIIEDNGIGIRVEDINRVFDKGFTGYNGRENYKSTGMGLYLAKKLCQKLGHDISIQSQYGEYTKVTIHFPKLIDYFNVMK